jgi:pyruvate/2-oxoglutarate dehydrogenase complex dihydrolipoamide dehydrogenase (E3) component
MIFLSNGSFHLHGTSKNIIHSAKVASYRFRGEEFGINVQIHMSAVCERNRKMVAGLVDVHLANYKSSGAELIMGYGRFIAPKRSRSRSTAEEPASSEAKK